MFRACHKGGTCGLRFSQPTKCQQHLSKMTDVSQMIARAIAGDSSVYRHGVNADLTGVPDDVQETLNIGVRAREAYEALAPEVRAAYPSPDAFLAALRNPSERDRLEKFGIVQPPPKADEPIAVRVIPEGNEAPKAEAHS